MPGKKKKVKVPPKKTKKVKKVKKVEEVREPDIFRSDCCGDCCEGTTDE